MAANRPRTIRVRAPAKLNLSLRILGRRRDGYHDLRTVFQSLELHDRLTFRPGGDGIDIHCTDPACPTGQDNLVFRAAHALWKEAGRGAAMPGLDVRIVKRIPIQSGLGGGSSNAAAALRALAVMWRLSLDEKRLLAIGRTLGADVPFFLLGGTVLGIERGDVLIPQHDAPPVWAVIVVPAFGVSTAQAFEWFDHRRGGGPALANDLEQPVAAHHPEIARLVHDLRHDATQAGMSGSGSAVFGLFPRRALAVQAARRMAAASGGRRVFVTRTLDRGAYARLTRPQPLHRTARRRVSSN